MIAAFFILFLFCFFSLQLFISFPVNILPDEQAREAVAFFGHPFSHVLVLVLIFRLLGASTIHIPVEHAKCGSHKYCIMQVVVSCSGLACRFKILRCCLFSALLHLSRNMKKCFHLWAYGSSCRVSFDITDQLIVPLQMMCCRRA